MTDGIALVTGAAGGIGAAVARLLATRGTEVVAVDLDGGRLADVVDKFTADGLPVTARPVDVSDGSAVAELVAEVERTVGPIGQLVNTAGVLHVAPAHELTEEQWSRTFAVNADGVFHTSRAVVRRMIARRSGAIVTVASNAAGTARERMAAYAASKAAATAYTKCLGLEVARYGIRCNVVAPGSTDTTMLHGMYGDRTAAAAAVAGDLATYKVGIPLGKVALPDDVARAVAFLLSDEAGHITLHELTVDGGATLGA
ncbi:2,3-dihydro-2,3-dihydroxybenzoate dehydrogenase [Streptomyces alkaliterrae]|uniref:2,3-dihydro-2,3-dihydroxybenzoate dehydrogenase n=1 Tax=Streptomyces alkaliterrae TaxID=2213162 RepID=A0A5P0YWH0_9ACTN|nr:2,3-dihydro-2,3-dihydroxybenzoate dehydrogenase [Streptomyces alkaliterrae]MBB1259288.1 2,3-dihydro-2,3-dihydroxybenzoate dehydrogenase [Streptomyces alkaliterrae]MQS04628.1 2,3-dihydro-2,3-dihydroxybenzoate dehydrogenase [Streptomyces alkaliterrae]